MEPWGEGWGGEVLVGGILRREGVWEGGLVHTNVYNTSTAAENRPLFLFWHQNITRKVFTI